jgi:hypothetical protein
LRRLLRPWGWPMVRNPRNFSAALVSGHSYGAMRAHIVIGPSPDLDVGLRVARDRNLQVRAHSSRSLPFKPAALPRSISAVSKMPSPVIHAGARETNSEPGRLGRRATLAGWISFDLQVAPATGFLSRTFPAPRCFCRAAWPRSAADRDPSRAKSQQPARPRTGFWRATRANFLSLFTSSL